MLKLKGVASKRINKEKKAKMKKTLKVMEKTRQIDSDNLREVIKKKLEWAQNERKKGIESIKKLQVQVNRLDGIVIFINDLLNPTEKK